MLKTRSFPQRIRELERYEGRFDAFKMAATGCDVLFAEYPAGTRIARHTHETDNWGVITKGAMYIEVDGVETRFGPGEWYEIGAGVEHAARCDEDTEEVEFWFATPAN